MYGNVTYKEALRSVGKGWWFLIRIAYLYKPENVRIAQVKQKFGGLRIYIEPYDPEYYKLMLILEIISFRTCEWCGNKGKADTFNYWRLTLCPDCIKKRANK